MKPGTEVHLCRRCGRKLRSEESKKRGMGATCYSKWARENSCKKLVTVSSLQTDKSVV